MVQESGEIRDGMRIDWDVPIPMDDGLVLRADAFRPIAAGRYPALVTYGPYAKGLAFQEGYATAWEIMARRHPEVTAGASNRRLYPALSFPNRPYHRRDAIEFLRPGEEPDDGMRSFHA